MKKLRSLWALQEGVFAKALIKGVRSLPVLGLHWIAAACILAITIAQLLGNPLHLSTSTYDSMVKHRVFAPQPDASIVIVDIDEASLAAMSDEYGRWPWPRDTLGSSLDYFQRVGAKGVVFDILMSDPDRIHPAGDEIFAKMVAKSSIAWFPVLRLNPRNDAESTLRIEQLKGFASPSPTAIKSATIAGVPPFFSSALLAGRLGYHNVYPDSDSVIRSYRYREAKDGWLLNALPTSIALSQGWEMPAHNEVLINWLNPNARHASVPFHAVFEDSLKKKPSLEPKQFKDKWVIIGATAASLHDVKATPVRAMHPGVEVLATALDNAKNKQYLYVLPRWLIGSLILLALLGSVYLVRKHSQSQLSFAFLFVPTCLLCVSFASLHVGSFFVDLTLPAQAAFLMLAFAKGHAYVLAWAHAKSALMYGHLQSEATYTLQTIAATQTASKAIADWHIYEALRGHTGVMALDNRASNHLLSDSKYRWWTMVTAHATQSTRDTQRLHLSAGIASMNSGFLHTNVVSTVREPTFSETAVKHHFWNVIAKNQSVVKNVTNLYTVLT